MAIIGIDLGTTNSLVSCFKDGEARIIPNVLGDNLTPSVVSIDKNSEILVGKVAKERLISDPTVSIANFKRFMGSEKKFILGKHNFTPEELSSFVLKSLKEDAEAFLGEEVTEAVISVPAYFNDFQRKATKVAGELAGLKVERLISEPTAAALAYGLYEAKEENQFLIFDLGGGTFDVSILDFFNGVAEVKAVAGDNYLGGEDFNKALINYFLYKNNLKVEDLDKIEIGILHKQAEKCKRELSSNVFGEMSLNHNNTSYKTVVTRQDFEKITLELVLRLRRPIERALKDSDITPNEIDRVVLIGGSTRMPIIRTIISKMFNKIPCSNINPDEAVALGAAVQATLKEKDSSFDEIILTDVCPYTLGIGVFNIDDNSNTFLPLIERNSPIPISRVEEDLCAIRDNQKSITVDIYQGESRNLKNNIKLGTVSVALPPQKKELSKISIRFTYDINSILEVEVFSLSTGETKKIILKQENTLMTDEEIEERLRSLSDLKIHPREQLENRLVLARAERIYEESLGEQRKYIDSLIGNFAKVIEGQNQKEIEKMRKYVEKSLNEVEEY